MVFEDAVIDEQDGTAIPQFLSSQENPTDYDVQGDSIWQQNFDDPWFATADVEFADGETTQTIPLTIFEDNVVDGNDTIVWRISDSVPFGFSQETYTFSEDDANNENSGIVLIELSLDSTIRTATITIEDTDTAADFTFASTDVPQPINDISTITSDLLVSGVSGALVDVNLMLDISHTFDADLDVFLISSAGTRVELFQDVGGGGDNFTNTTLDDEAATSISSGAAPFSGSFQPLGALSTFDGESPNGIWSLEITDDLGEDVGTLNSWSLTFTV